MKHICSCLATFLNSPSLFIKQFNVLCEIRIILCKCEFKEILFFAFVPRTCFFLLFFHISIRIFLYRLQNRETHTHTSVVDFATWNSLCCSCVYEYICYDYEHVSAWILGLIYTHLKLSFPFHEIYASTFSFGHISMIFYRFSLSL